MWEKLRALGWGERLERSADEPGENGLVGEKVQGKERRQQGGLGSSGFQGSNSRPIGPRLDGGEEGTLFLPCFQKGPLKDPFSRNLSGSSLEIVCWGRGLRGQLLP